MSGIEPEPREAAGMSPKGLGVCVRAAGRHKIMWEPMEGSPAHTQASEERVWKAHYRK